MDNNDRLNDINNEIRALEAQIADAKLHAEDNILPLTQELEKIRQDKRSYASKNDFESVQDCMRREDNLKFRINAQWNEYSILKNSLLKLKKRRDEVENEIRLEKDRVRRKNEILSKMETVLENYRRTHDLKRSAIESDINPEHVSQWFEWGKANFNDTYAYFHSKVLEIDEEYNKIKSQDLIDQMDRVIEAYESTGSLKEASRLAGVSYDAIQYWIKWGSMGFGRENSYFYSKIK